MSSDGDGAMAVDESKYFVDDFSFSEDFLCQLGFIYINYGGAFFSGMQQPNERVLSPCLSLSFQFVFVMTPT